MICPHQLVAGLAITLSLLWPMTPSAATPAAEWRPQDATQGSLWLRDEQDNRYQPAPTLDTRVDMDITGMLARVQVRQTFHNPGNRWAEGIYVFPLPEQAAVDHLRMVIGERVIEGQIKERAQARKTYQQAKEAGQRASLVEQERANIFTTSLANIAPGESISIEIEYQQTVRYSDGAFRLRFPMVVGPRYIPGTALDLEDEVRAFAGSGWARATTRVADAARVTPPVRHPDHGPINPVSLDIRLNAGMPLAEVSSSYHPIDTQWSTEGHYRIQLAEKQVPADRDFELVWRPPAASAPQGAWFVERGEENQYGLLMLVPPQQDAEHAVLSREVVFVIDTSGSMHGESIEQARRALLLALDRLTGRDRFNIIRFNNSADSLFAQTQTADPANLAIARQFVRSLHASGGTEMRPALQTALQHDGQARGLRQVVFLTDGSVGNERELFELIRNNLGNSRLFTVGIGSAPNSYFMRKAAEYGRGTFTYIGKTAEVMEKTAELFLKLERASLTDIRLELPPGLDLETLPRRIPDLYAGEPLLVALRGPALPDWVVVHGKLAEQPWSTRVTLEGGQQGTALAPEWGRRKIADLMTRLHDAQHDDAREALRRQVVATGLRHHLVSRYTSLVAVDVTPARQMNELLNQHALKTNLPKGWSHEHVFGLPQTATPARLRLTTGLLMLLVAALIGVWAGRQPC
jgi:Ca-activated chloride channel family protein